MDPQLPLDISSEAHLKTAVIAHAFKIGLISRGAIVASEVALGTHRRRADLAVGDQRLVAFEIKSASDTLRRLPDQLQAYSASFDATVLVLTKKHLADALAVAPRHVGIWIADVENGLRVLRHAYKRSTATTEGIFNTLTLAELERAFGNKGLKRSAWSELSKVIDVKTARAATLDAFRRRFSDTSTRFWQGVLDEREISLENIAQLSRYANRRRIVSEHRSRQERFWNDWTKLAQVEFDKRREPTWLGQRT